jgi:hypothetical protein
MKIEIKNVEWLDGGAFNSVSNVESYVLEFHHRSPEKQENCVKQFIADLVKVENATEFPLDYPMEYRESRTNDIVSYDWKVIENEPNNWAVDNTRFGQMEKPVRMFRDATSCYGLGKFFVEFSNEEGIVGYLSVSDLVDFYTEHNAPPTITVEEPDSSPKYELPLFSGNMFADPKLFENNSFQVINNDSNHDDWTLLEAEKLVIAGRAKLESLKAEHAKLLSEVKNEVAALKI